MLMSVFLHLLITVIVPASTAPDPKSNLPLVLLVVSMVVLILSFALPRALRRLSPRAAAPAFVLALAMCEAVSIFGLLLHFAVAWPYYWIFMLLGGAGMLVNFPRRTAFNP